MADNVAITPSVAANAVSVAADDIGGVAYQRVKLVWGADGTANDADSATGRGLPVQSQRGTKTFGSAAPTASAVSVLAANANRISALLTNTGSVRVYLGKDNTVTTSSPVYLDAGDVLIDSDSTDAWWGITASGTGAIATLEVA